MCPPARWGHQTTSQSHRLRARRQSSASASTCHKSSHRTRYFSSSQAWYCRSVLHLIASTKLISSNLSVTSARSFSSDSALICQWLPQKCRLLNSCSSASHCLLCFLTCHHSCWSDSACFADFLPLEYWTGLKPGRWSLTAWSLLVDSFSCLVTTSSGKV